jgi:hypothetical protein
MDNALMQATEDWMAGVLPLGVRFRLNDPVDVVAGPDSGKSAAVISLVALSPEPKYLLEDSDGHDFYALQSHLRAI